MVSKNIFKYTYLIENLIFNKKVFLKFFRILRRS